jgi:predicted negative regulator of RcsB-dependent stress response
VYAEGERQEALSKALRLDEATTGTEINPAMAHFDTPDDKAKAVNVAFTGLALKYSGSQEGAIAEMYLAGAAAEKGDFADAEKRLKNVVDHAPDSYASMARVSLAQVYASENKMADAEKLMREAIDHPSATVSKESAQLTLAGLLSKSNPTEARKLLDPLRSLSSRPAVTRAAIALGGEMSNQSGATGAIQVPVPAPGKK